MKKLLALLLVAVAAAKPNDPACPTVTTEIVARECSRRCSNAHCTIVSSVYNPCDCPDEVATATIIHLCASEVSSIRVVSASRPALPRNTGLEEDGSRHDAMCHDAMMP